METSFKLKPKTDTLYKPASQLPKNAIKTDQSAYSRHDAKYQRIFKDTSEQRVKQAAINTALLR